MSWCLEVGHLLETSWWGLEVGHFLLDKLIISRDGPPLYYISWWSLEVGPPCLCAMSWCLEVGPLSWWNVSWSLEVGPPIDPGLKLQYKTGLKSGWLFNTFTLWSKGGPTSMVNFSRGAHLQLQLLWFQRYTFIDSSFDPSLRNLFIQTTRRRR